MENLRVLFLYYIEEAVILVFLGLSLFNIRVGWRKILLVGILEGAAVYFIRSTYALLNIGLGSHILLNLLAMVIFIRYVIKVRWGIATAIGLLSFLLSIMSDAVMYPMILKQFGITVDELHGQLIHIALRYIAICPLIILALILRATGFSLIKFDDKAWVE